jgi:hypothetical protein
MEKFYASALINRLRGGTTHPFMMEVCDKNGNYKGHYVVKVFTQKDEKQVQATAKEFIANQLAIEFDLCVPDAALVWVRKEIIIELKEKCGYRDIIAGWYFATNYIDNIIDYQKDFTTKKISVLIQQNIFAFDMLIQNKDRRIGKPNCFVKDGECYLIDHELSLQITESYKQYYQQCEWQGLAIGYEIKDREHIFYETLKSNKGVNFDEFQLYLHNISLNSVIKIVNLLADEGIVVEIFDSIEPYLQDAKKNSAKFSETLKRILL